MDFLRTLLGVCSGMKFYRLALDWTPANALKYLLKLALFLALTSSPIVLWNGYRWANAALDQLEYSKVLPEFFIKGGRVHATAPQPYRRVFQDFALVLDTTSAKPQPPAGAIAGITITATNVLVWSQIDPNPTAIETKLFPDGQVNVAYLRTLLRESLWVSGILLAIMVFLGFFCGSLLQVTMFDALASFIEQGIEPSYRFDQLFIFGALAITPAAIAALIYMAFGIGFENLLLVYLFVFAFYFTGSTTVCRRLLLPPGSRVDDDE